MPANIQTWGRAKKKVISALPITSAKNHIKEKKLRCFRVLRTLPKVGGTTQSEQFMSKHKHATQE